MSKRILYVILVFLMLIVYFNYIQPIPEKRQIIREEIYLKSKKLQKYQNLTKQKESIKRQIEKLELEKKKVEATFLPVSNETLGLVTIQQIVRDLSSKANLKIIALRPLDVIKSNYLVGLPVQVTAIGNIKSLTEFFKGISENPYLLSVDMLNIRVVNVQKPDKLRIKFTITGYIKKANNLFVKGSRGNV